MTARGYRERAKAVQLAGPIDRLSTSSPRKAESFWMQLPGETMEQWRARVKRESETRFVGVSGELKVEAK